MQFQIKSRYSGAVLFSLEVGSLKLCVEAAVKSGADLSRANLSRANLSGANLSRANLSGANLYGADLYGADLYGANLYGANLSGADLSGADLSGADLSRANLSGADLSRADLSRANLSRANLSGANLSRANLSRANLSGADLSGADLSGANLYGADLSGANLSGANLSGADLYGADLSGAKNLRLPTGETWKEYLTETVPALCTAGGRKLEEVANEKVWGCHAWDNCPMHEAFGAANEQEVPPLYRMQARQFIQLFDAKQIPLDVVTGKRTYEQYEKDCAAELAKRETAKAGKEAK